MSRIVVEFDTGFITNFQTPDLQVKQVARVYDNLKETKSGNVRWPGLKDRPKTLIPVDDSLVAAAEQLVLYFKWLEQEEKKVETS